MVLLDLRSGQEFGVVSEGVVEQFVLGPAIGGQEGVSVGNGSEGSLGKVTEGLGRTLGGSVNVINTGNGQNLLGDTSRHDTSTTRSRYQTDSNGTALSGHLARNGVGQTDLVTPETSANRDDRELGGDDSTTDGSGNFLGALNTQTAVTVGVTDHNVGLESGTLTGHSLLLNGGDLENFILKSLATIKEVINNLELLDGDGVEVDVL